MTNEFDAADEPRDRTKLIWIGIGILLLGMVIALWSSGRVQSNRTYVQAKHILIAFEPESASDRMRALETITELRAQIVADEGSFGRLAKEYSDDVRSGSRGGHLGPVERGVYMPKFESYVWSAPIGVLSEITETRYGFHLIVVVERNFSDLDRYERKLEQKVLAGDEAVVPE